MTARPIAPSIRSTPTLTTTEMLTASEYTRPFAFDLLRPEQQRSAGTGLTASPSTIKERAVTTGVLGNGCNRSRARTETAIYSTQMSHPSWTISNPKVAGAGLEPLWAPFPGFSLLLDPPAANFRASGDVETLHCDIEEPALSLYRALHEGLQCFGLKRLSNDFWFCPLPPPSYHVTVLDGGNADNFGSFPERDRAPIEELAGSSARADFHSTASREFLSEGPANILDMELRLRFLRLSKWSNVSLVAQLEPADIASEATFDRLVRSRAQLLDKLESRYGVRLGKPDFHPHVTLGYFASPSGGEACSHLVDECHGGMSRAVAGLEICFQTISLYAFSDMATFYRRRR